MDVPLTNNGLFTFQVQNVMCAVAAALGLNVPFNTIRAALGSFQSTPDTVPGRFNFFKHNGGSVIADYGHNPDAVSTLVDTLKNIPAVRRTVVISAAGDRRDQDIIEQGRWWVGSLITLFCMKTLASVAAQMVKRLLCCSEELPTQTATKNHPWSKYAVNSRPFKWPSMKQAQTTWSWS